MDIAYKKIKPEIYNHQLWIDNTDPTWLKTHFENCLKIAEFTILSFTEHYFPVQGYTCFWLLGESHLAIHTFPESNKAYLELSSCNESKLKAFLEALK